MTENCVLCDEEMSEDDEINYVEMPTASNIHNGSYYSLDSKKQYKTICKYEFDEPDGYIYIYNKNLKPNPAKFLYKQGIVINENPSNDDGITLKEIENVCKVARHPDKKGIQIYMNKLEMIEKIILK